MDGQTLGSSTIRRTAIDVDRRGVKRLRTQRDCRSASTRSGPRASRPVSSLIVTGGVMVSATVMCSDPKLRRNAGTTVAERLQDVVAGGTSGRLERPVTFNARESRIGRDAARASTHGEHDTRPASGSPPAALSALPVTRAVTDAANVRSTPVTLSSSTCTVCADSTCAVAGSRPGRIPRVANAPQRGLRGIERRHDQVRQLRWQSEDAGTAAFVRESRPSGGCRDRPARRPDEAAWHGPAHPGTARRRCR